jgi:hypothetical protein
MPAVAGSTDALGLIRNLNFDYISILQLMLLLQLHFAGDFDNFSRLRLAVGFVCPQDDSRPAKYSARHDTDRDSPTILFGAQAFPLSWQIKGRI